MLGGECTNHYTLKIFILFFEFFVKQLLFMLNSISCRSELKCDHCADYRVSSIDCTTNCSRCGGETGGSGSSTAHTTATDLTNPEGLEECYEKVPINYSLIS